MDLKQAVGWRPTFWVPPCRFVIGDPSRFAGKRLLDLGSRDGGMARYFASLGAEVEACDNKPSAVAEIQAKGIDAFLVDDNWDALPVEKYDFIFTKSVLVVAPDLHGALTNLRKSLRAGGEYLAVENWTFPALEAVRFIANRRRFSSRFSYLSESLMPEIQSHFHSLSMKLGPMRLAVGIRASVGETCAADVLAATSTPNSSARIRHEGF